MTNLLERGMELMLFGMGTVFVFLTLLVLITSLMSKLVQRFEPEPAEQAAGESRSLTPTTVAVISAAIHQHRRKHSHK